MNLPSGWTCLFALCFLAFLGGCATQPAQEADPFAAIEAMDVKFMHEPPANSKFIAKVAFSSGSYSHWEADYDKYMRVQAVKLGGNVVVPGTELYLDPKYYNNYNNPAAAQNLQLSGVGGAQMRPNPVPMVRPTLTSVHFWSNIYYCSDYH